MLEDLFDAGPGLDALINSVRQQANRVIELSPNTPDEAAQVLASITAPSALADFLAANLQAEAPEKQRMLEEMDVERRLRLIAARLATPAGRAGAAEQDPVARSRRTSTRASGGTTCRSR